MTLFRKLTPHCHKESFFRNETSYVELCLCCNRSLSFHEKMHTINVYVYVNHFVTLQVGCYLFAKYLTNDAKCMLCARWSYQAETTLHYDLCCYASDFNQTRKMFFLRNPGNQRKKSPSVMTFLLFFFTGQEGPWLNSFKSGHN